MLIPLLVALAPAAPVPAAAEPPVVCTAKLVPLPDELYSDGNYPDDGFWAEVVLTNRTKAAVTVPTGGEWKDRVSVRLTDAAGKVVTKPSAPAEEPEHSLTLKPGEAVKFHLHLFREALAPGEEPKPGKYTVTVVFEAGKLRSETAAIAAVVK